MSVASPSLLQSRYDVTSESADSFRYRGRKPRWRTGSAVSARVFLKKVVSPEDLSRLEKYLKLFKDCDYKHSTSKEDLNTSCRDPNHPVLAGNLRFLVKVSGLPFSGNILPVFETPPNQLFSLFNQSF